MPLAIRYCAKSTAVLPARQPRGHIVLMPSKYVAPLLLAAHHQQFPPLIDLRAGFAGVREIEGRAVEIVEKRPMARMVDRAGVRNGKAEANVHCRAVSPGAARPRDGSGPR